jgi:nucleoside 2-deoxyribosyltransferase
MSKPRAYLAGPIKGLQYNAAVTWRESMAQTLSPDIACLSPMRGKQDLRTFAGPLGAEYSDAFNLLCSPRAIFTRDYNDVTRSDLVIAYLTGADAVSIGTMFELAWCHALRKPLVIIDDRRTETHHHPFVTEAADWIVSDFYDAAHIARSVLLP